MSDVLSATSNRLLRIARHRDGSAWFELRLSPRNERIVHFLDTDIIFRLPEAGKSGFPEVISANGASAHEISVLLEQQLLPMLNAERGALVLHCAAIAIDEYAMLIVGPSGSGKSTLSVGLAAHQAELISDDSIELKEFDNGRYRLVGMSHPVRLWPDSFAALGETTELMLNQSTCREAFGKLSIQSTAVPRDSTASIASSTDSDQKKRVLRALYFLRENNIESVSIEPLPLQLAFIGLLESTFALDTSNASFNAAVFASLTSLSQRVPTFTLDYPRDFTALGHVCGQVLNHFKRVCETPNP
jgi:energy-coupling factor transporter ATP-binding protein EcfA2